MFLVGYWESLERFSGKDLGTDLLRSCVEDTLSTVPWTFSPQNTVVIVGKARAS